MPVLQSGQAAASVSSAEPAVPTGQPDCQWGRRQDVGDGKAIWNLQR